MHMSFVLSLGMNRTLVLMLIPFAHFDDDVAAVLRGLQISSSSFVGSYLAQLAGFPCIGAFCSA